MTQPLLYARNLVKRYGRVTAMDHADFDLYPGEILAVIGVVHGGHAAIALDQVAGGQKRLGHDEIFLIH